MILKLSLVLMLAGVAMGQTAKHDKTVGDGVEEQKIIIKEQNKRIQELEGNTRDVARPSGYFDKPVPAFSLPAEGYSPFPQIIGAAILTDNGNAIVNREWYDETIDKLREYDALKATVVEQEKRIRELEKVIARSQVPPECQAFTDVGGNYHAAECHEIWHNGGGYGGIGYIIPKPHKIIPQKAIFHDCNSAVVDCSKIMPQKSHAVSTTPRRTK